MIAPSGSGGTLQYAHNLCDALAAEGHQVVLATALDCEVASYPRHYQLIGVFDRFRPHPGPLARFVRLVRRMQPDIVHLQGAQRPEFYWLLLKVLRRLCRAKFVWTPQDVTSNSEKPYYRRLQTRNYARMSHVFLNARQNAPALIESYGVSEEKITVLPIPDLLAFVRRDLGRSLPPEMPPGKGPLVLCFGLIEPRKGIGQMIEAFARIPPQHNARLVIMGRPLTDIAPYEKALATFGLPPDRVRLIPRYASFEEMNGLFEDAMMIVLPYVAGWNSGVLAAAYGFGKPVVATRVGGFEEVVRDGVSGLLVPAGDAEALSEAITRILSDPELARRLGEGAAAENRRASWDSVAATISSIYDSVLEEPSSA